MAEVPPNRFEEQEAWIPRQRLLEESATVIGVGGIGRQVALQLVALGVPKLQLIDPAIVQARHVTSQGFFAEDVSWPKVDMVGGFCHQTEPMLDLEAIAEEFQSTHEVGKSVFCCIGSEDVRSRIRRVIGNRVGFWGESHMIDDRVRVCVAASEWIARRFANEPTSSVDEHRDTSSHGQIYGASLGAALLVHQFVRYLQGLPLCSDASFDFSIPSYMLGVSVENGTM